MTWTAKTAGIEDKNAPNNGYCLNSTFHIVLLYLYTIIIRSANVLVVDEVRNIPAVVRPFVSADLIVI